MSSTVVIVSPHLDDAVLSCGQLIAALPHRAVVIMTVFAAEPEEGDHIWTEYDKKCGFPSARVAVGMRRAEDRRACSVLNARWEHLSFVDSQYVEQPTPADVAASLARHVQALVDADDTPHMLVGPVGLQHIDHVLVSSAFLMLAEQTPINAWLYEELPYRVQWPEQVPDALARAEALFHVEQDHIGGGSMSVKTAAVACYRSQQWALDGHSHLVPERYWRLRRRENDNA